MPTTSPTRADLRTHYRRIEQMIKRERAARVTVLRNAPNLPAKLDECDAALASLAELGKAVATLMPPEPEQGRLIEGASAPRRY
jgi:hypothetical protein